MEAPCGATAPILLLPPFDETTDDEAALRDAAEILVDQVEDMFTALDETIAAQPWLAHSFGHRDGTVNTEYSAAITEVCLTLAVDLLGSRPMPPRPGRGAGFRRDRRRAPGRPRRTEISRGLAKSLEQGDRATGPGSNTQSRPPTLLDDAMGSGAFSNCRRSRTAVAVSSSTTSS